MIAGIAVSHFLQHNPHNGSDELRAIHELRDFEAIAPGSADAFLGNGDVATGAERDVHTRIPITRGVQIGAKCLLDAFAGDDEQRGFEFEEF